MTLTMTLRKFAPLFAGLLLAFAIAGHFVNVGLAQEDQAPTSAVGRARAAVKTCQTDKDPLACLGKLESSDVCRSGGKDDAECMQIIQNAIVKAGGAPKFTKNAPPEGDSAKFCGITWWAPISFATCGIFVVSWVWNAIAGLLVAMAAWLAQLALGLSAHVFELPVVQRGFTVTLALANLGFVLGIIVIAIATILRIENYGMKQILWKLVVMAILVNFSMVIAGQIVGFSNTVADYFIDKTAPSTGLGAVVGGGANTRGTTSYFRFVDAITAGFAPQSFFQPPEENWGVDGSSLSDFVIMLFSTIFSMLFLVIIALCLFLMAILFLIRFVYLGVLLILMPLAWMMWVFPLFKSNWDKWWHNFLKWSFFAPLCVFFLYLAIMASSKGDQAGQTYIGNLVTGNISDKTDSNTVSAALGKLTGNGPGILATAAEAFMVLGLAFGGFFAANSLSITGAHAAMGAVKAAGKATGGWTRDWAGGKAARFATKKEPDRLPPNAGWGARMQHRIATSAPAMALRRGVQKVTAGDTAQRMGVTQKLEKFGKETDFGPVKNLLIRAKTANREAGELEPIARHAREANMMRTQSHALEKIKLLREKAAEKEQEAAAPNARPSEVPGLKKEADEARLEADAMAKNSSEEVKAFDGAGRWDDGIKEFGSLADKATKRAEDEAGKTADPGKRQEFINLVRQGNVAARVDELRENARNAYNAANEQAKKNPRLVSRVVYGALGGAGIFAPHKSHISDKQLKAMLEAAGLEVEHPAGHSAPPYTPASGGGGGGTAPSGGGAAHHP